ncbi:MAG: type II toxin-antitoxin system VapC family toxin [Archaeoglobaceae archaeon]|nr:type II toxin-antitoxin system VapC family toxin [Archaeoglobaceae archaeon]
MIVLDTSFLIDYFRGLDVTRKLISKEDEFATTAITYYEIFAGVRRKKSAEEKFFRRFFSEIKILLFDVKSADEASNIAAKLFAIGKEVNALDILIAGIAVANGAEKILTRDRDFLEIAKVSDLEVVFYE